MSDQRVEKWVGLLKQPIRPSIITMHLHRAAWRDVAEILNENGDLPDSYWWEFMFETYATTQAIAVRRQADMHKDAVSLRKLIAEIAGDPERITREFHLDLWQPGQHFEGHARRTWDEHFAGVVGSHLDPAIPVDDLKVLDAAVQRVKSHVDQHVAHTDGAAVSATVTLTLTEVHASIDVIGTLFKKYSGLLTASSERLVPVMQGDWHAAFRVPWMKAPDEQTA